MAEIFSIVYQPAPSENTEPYHYNRVPIEQATLIAGHGIDGDLKAGHHPDRQLNVMSFETLAQLEPKGYQVNPGQMGEQIIVKGVDVMALPVGSRLQFGDETIIEITKARQGCSWFEQIQSKKANETPMGIMARVIVGGQITVGDAVKVLEPVNS